jgi:DNA primase
MVSHGGFDSRPGRTTKNTSVLFMGKIPEYIVNEINSKADLLEIASNCLVLKKSGANHVADCPSCTGKKGLSISRAKSIAKCFHCGLSAKTAVSFLMNFKKLKYPEALKYVADYYHINWEEEEGAPVAKAVPGTAKRKAVKKESSNTAVVLSFRDKQLAASGLEDSDQKILIKTDEPGKEIEIDRYSAGTLNERYEIGYGDDMCMRYVALNRELMMYMNKEKTKERPMFRMRWQNPAIHPDKKGNPIKYQSPADSGSKLWFPCAFIHRWESGAVFETLFFHEGEKKADKSQKHGMNSIGMMGIHNLAQDGKLPHEVELIVRRGTKKVVFLVDSDYRDLGKNLTISASARPSSFMKAVYNFQRYFFAFNNEGISLEIYFAYIKPNELNEKGIDDLLTGSCKGKEDEVVRDVFRTMNLKNGEGQYLNVHNITAWSLSEFLKHFHLENVQRFALFYRKQLSQYPVFKYKNELWKYNDDETSSDIVVLAQPLSEEEKFWEEKTRRSNGGKEETVLRFNYYRCFKFLHSRGFSVHKNFDKKDMLVKVEKKVVTPIESIEIDRYVKEFVETMENEDLSNLIISGDERYFNESKLKKNLKYLQPEFLQAGRGVEYFLFNDKYWVITADKITEAPLNSLERYVFKDQISDRNANVLNTPILRVTHIPEGTNADVAKGHFQIDWSEDAERCQFLLYLYRASNFYKEKEAAGTALTPEECNECDRHFLQKLTAFGYLIHTHPDPRVTKAVVAMDGKISEVGTSEGRSGKSLYGLALKQVRPMVTVPGKEKNLTEDRFLLEEVEPGKTKILGVDDVRVNFDFEHFFPFITGNAKYETKGVRRTTLPFEKTPKLFITTNHAINERGGSFAARMIKLSFSDWYYDDGNGNVNTPLKEFGVSFFTEWEFDQWNLFFNLAAVSLQVYFQYGIIPAPNDRIERRRLRQDIGETFIDWADTYFSTSNNVNRPIERKQFTDDFHSAHPELRKTVDARRVKQKLIMWCKFSYKVFNPGRENKGHPHGGDHKSGGVEYFTVADEKNSHLNFDVVDPII